ncbi:MAG: DUF4340 domain-containing protein [Candidatus Electryoneaceae bacterium]|nr:DUF4340 domain-containing protein [Candidatus Electryoneaceae bacterium]
MSRTVTILGVVLIVQIILYAIVSIDPHRVEQKEKFLANDTSQVDYVHIKNEDGEITMKRMGGTWRITDPYDYAVNLSHIQTFLKRVADLEYEASVTSNPDNYEQYELEEGTAPYVEVGKENGKIDKFYCGKLSETYTHIYARRADSDEVLLLNGTPRSSFVRKPSDWRDKRVLSINKAMIERVKIIFPDETVELVREISTPVMDTVLMAVDTTWTVIPTVGEPFEPDSKPLNRVFNTLKRLNCRTFLEAGTDEIPDFDDAEFRVEVYLEGNRREVVEIISLPDPDADPDEEEPEPRWIVRKDGDNGMVFEVYKSSVKNLRKRAEDLRPEPVEASEN